MEGVYRHFTLEERRTLFDEVQYLGQFTALVQPAGRPK